MRRLQLVDVADDAKTPVEHDPDEPFELRANSPLGVEAEQRLGSCTRASRRPPRQRHRWWLLKRQQWLLRRALPQGAQHGT